MRPHWLAEIVVDVCMAGIDHAEQNIQRRSSSLLLLEMIWSQAHKSLREGYCPIVASMYLTFIEKVLGRTNYMATRFSPKSQVRQDLILCVVVVLQSSPHGLLRASWRKLFSRSPGEGKLEKYGGTVPKAGELDREPSESESEWRGVPSEIESKEGPDIYDMFGLLNVYLATVEYEGCDEHAEVDARKDNDGPIGYWRKEFLLTRIFILADSIIIGFGRPSKARHRRMMSFGRSSKTDN